MYPLFCILCLLEGKEIPPRGTSLSSAKIWDLAAVTVLDGNAMCRGHLQLFMEKGETKVKAP